MKKILIVFVLFLLICLSGCYSNKKYYYNSDFVFGYFPNGSKSYVSKDTIYLMSISDNGKEKTHLVVPNEYQDLAVYICNTSLKSKAVNLDSEKLEKVYISNKINDLKYLYTKDDIKNFCIANNIKNYPKSGNNYISLKAYLEVKDNKKLLTNNRLFFANVSYLYNYDESLNNGYYFIDYYENEVIDFIPKEPIREGYVFLGWYKEKDCINEWNFEEDIVPYDNKVIDETILYAKWEKKD